MKWKLFICGAAFLSIASWIDNLRGPLLPVVTQLMNLDYAAAGMIMSLGNCVAMAATWLLMPLLNRWSLHGVGLGILSYALVICGSTIFIQHSFGLYLWGALIGGCISTMGSMSNLFVQASVANERRGQMMLALHSLYGLCSFMAPWIAGIVLKNPSHWQYLFASTVPLVIGLMVYLHWSTEKKSTQQENLTTGSSEAFAKKSTAKQSLKLEPLHVLCVFLMIAYVVGETLTSTWMPSFLISEYHLSIQEASRYTSYFFATMLLSRMACGIWAKPNHHRILLWIGLTSSVVCFTLGRLTGCLWLLPLAGLFGPFFPLYVTWVSFRFRDRDRTLLIWMLSGYQAGLAIMNIAVGEVADRFGFGVAYWFPAIMIATALVLLKILEIKEKSAETMTTIRH